MPFRSALRMESIRGTDRYKILSDLVYETWDEDIIIAPEGFITDLASIPLMFRWLFPKAGKYKDAAVIHDYLYKVSMKSRKDADKQFSRAMADLGVSWWRRAMIYRAVRIGGKKTWDNYRK